jgi:ribonucleotide reductase alpha subunit
MANNNSFDMRVTKRNGEYEEIAFDKILNRVKKLGQEANIHINYQQLTMKVIDQLYDTISTTKIDELAAEQCAAMSTLHPDYGTLSGRIVVSNHQKNTEASFSNVMSKLYNFNDIHGQSNPLVSNELYHFTLKHRETIDTMIDHNRDYLIDYFGFKTLERAYLFRINGKVIERIQHMWMRVSIGIHYYTNNNANENENDNKCLTLIKETYDLMSNKYFTHATPTLFNAGTPRPQLSSCYLIAMQEDSIAGIYDTLKDCALISKFAGGIGLHIHNIRAKGTHIQGTNGTSNGIVPMLRVFNNTARYVDQCLDPETIIYSKRGPIAIKNIVIGDKVITDDGNMYLIRKVLDYNYFGDIYKLNIKHTLQPLIATDMHPLWVIKNDYFYQTNFTNIINDLDRNLIKPEFIEIKNITKNDFIGFPIPKYEKDISHYTDDDCRMYGILLGDGNISSVNNLAYVSLNKETKKETIAFIENYLSKLNIHITYSYSNDKNVRLVWSRTNMFKFTYDMLYDHNKEKHIMNQILHLSKNKILNVIKGILETDGHVSNKQIILEITSKSIVEGVRYMLLRLGILTSGRIRNRIGQQHETKYGKIIKTKKISYVLVVPKKPIICNLFQEKCLMPSETFTFFEYNNFLYSIVIENEHIKNYSGRVIDIEVDNEEHHNFLTHNGLVKNGGGKRNGSFAIYLEPWHSDIFDFLDLKKNHGEEELKARDLFYALWIPDLFMERVKKPGGQWSLMCPHECPGLSDVYGEDFVKLYEKYEAEGKVRKTVSARDLWFAILDAQMETGTPYLCYKDAANKKSNQKNLGTIKSSNLCSEITLYSDDKETAVCNLASIALPSFVNHLTKEFDYDKLLEVTKVITYNLNRVIDINFYPTEKTKRSNLRHRPIGIGIQGLADTFILMDIPFHSEKAKEVNKLIFETIYYAALTKSNQMAIELRNQIKSCNNNIELLELLNEYDKKSSLDCPEYCGSYSTFKGSPASQGILQFDMWSVTPSTKYDWNSLKESIIKYGLRNSTLLAPMPTASTSQILGYNECFEPLTSNIYSRRTLAGEFVIVNKYLMKDLIQMGLWNEQIKNNIVTNKGSIQQLTILPQELRDKYKIVWEIPMKHVIDMAADRGAYVCQSQSLNLWMEDPVYNKLTSMHFYAWEKGLKTGIYYLRRKAKHQAQQFTIEPEKKQKLQSDNKEEEEVCEMCSA